MRPMLSSRLVSPRYTQFGLVLGSCAVAFMLASTPVRALDDGDDNLFHEMTTLLGVDGDKSPDIDYRDRAPLVLPPKGNNTLAKPKTASDKPHPEWPNDPDVMKARKAAAEAKMPIVNDFKSGPGLQDRDARLASRVAPSEPLAPQTYECNVKHCPPTQEQIAAVDKSLSGLTQTNTVAPGQEPDREWLTEPPKGYRKPTQIVDDKEPASAQDSSNPFSFFKKLLPGS